MKYIVYTSNAGHTKEYAELLAGSTNLECMDLNKAKSKLSPSDEIIFMGWIMAGKIHGFDFAKAHFKIAAVCGVGMEDSTELTEKLDKNNETDPVKRYYLQGGIDVNRLKGLKKMMIKAIVKEIIAELEKKAERTTQEENTLDVIKNNRNCVCIENLEKIIAWAKADFIEN